MPRADVAKKTSIPSLPALPPAVQDDEQTDLSSESFASSTHEPIGNITRWLRGTQVRSHTENIAVYKVYDAHLKPVCEAIARHPALLKLFSELESNKRRNDVLPELEKLVQKAEEASRRRGGASEQQHRHIARKLMKIRPEVEQIFELLEKAQALVDVSVLHRRAPEPAPEKFALQRCVSPHGSTNGKTAVITLAREAQSKLILAEDLGEIRLHVSALKKLLDELYESNYRLIGSVIKKFRYRGLAEGDLFQEGSLGLTKGLQKFDWTLGNQLGTYCTWWIRQGIIRAIANQANDIRIPVHMQELMHKVTRIEEQLIAADPDCKPSAADIALEGDLDIDKVTRALALRKREVSLSTLVGDEDSEFGDFLKDEKSPDPSDESSRSSENAITRQMLSILTDREREILELRFGLRDGGKGFTLEEIGAMYRLTRERIRQIQEKALRKLRKRKDRFLKGTAE